MSINHVRLWEVLRYYIANISVVIAMSCNNHIYVASLPICHNSAIRNLLKFTWLPAVTTVQDSTVVYSRK